MAGRILRQEHTWRYSSTQKVWAREGDKWNCKTEAEENSRSQKPLLLLEVSSRTLLGLSWSQDSARESHADYSQFIPGTHSRVNSVVACPPGLTSQNRGQDPRIGESDAAEPVSGQAQC